MSKENIKIEYVPVEELHFAEYNPRRATAQQTDQLEANIRKFGFVDPILVNSNPDRKNIIIGGHFRVRVAKKIGIETIPVVYINIPTIEEEKELNIRLNKNTGEWDWDMLSSHFDNKELIDWGFNESELGIDMGGSNKEVSAGSLDSKSVVTFSFDASRYHGILEALERGKEKFELDTNEDLLEKLLDDYV